MKRLTVNAAPGDFETRSKVYPFLGYRRWKDWPQKVAGPLRRRMLAWVVVAGMAALGAVSSELAPTPLSRLLKAIAANSGEGISRVACNDPEVARALRREGVRVEPTALLAWASSEAEVRELSREGKLVICPNQDWVDAGASVVVQVEGGRPVYYLYQDQAKRSGVYLRAVVYHYAKERR